MGAGVGLVLDVSHGRSEVVAAAMIFNQGRSVCHEPSSLDEDMENLLISVIRV